MNNAAAIDAGRRLFSVIDADGLLRHHWLTDEPNARHFHERHFSTLTLIGPRGETLARPEPIRFVAVVKLPPPTVELPADPSFRMVHRFDPSSGAHIESYRIDADGQRVTS